jgi:hypothetical protein
MKRGIRWTTLVALAVAVSSCGTSDAVGTLSATTTNPVQTAVPSPPTEVPSTSAVLTTTPVTLPKIDAVDALLTGVVTDGLSPSVLGDEGRFNWRGITSEVVSIAQPSSLTMTDGLRGPAAGQSLFVVRLRTHNASPSAARTLVIDGKRLALPAIEGDLDESIAFTAAANATAVVLEYETAGLSTTYDLLTRQRAAAPNILYASPTASYLRSDLNYSTRAVLPSSDELKVEASSASLVSTRSVDWAGNQAVLAGDGLAWLAVSIRVNLPDGGYHTDGGLSEADVALVAADGTYTPTLLRDPGLPGMMFAGVLYFEVPETVRAATVRLALSGLTDDRGTASNPAQPFEIPITFGNS